MRRECQQLATKVSELELESNEHQLVIDTLTPIEPERRAFHLVNGVLIQKSAGVVLPEVASRKASIEALIEQLKGFLATKEKDSKEWKEKYNIRTQQEHEAMQKAREAEATKAGRAAGDGASPSGLLMKCVRASARDSKAGETAPAARAPCLLLLRNQLKSSARGSPRRPPAGRAARRDRDALRRLERPTRAAPLRRHLEDRPGHRHARRPRPLVVEK